MTVVLVFVGAMIGALLRYLTGLAVSRHHDGLFPWGTFLVNVAGCLVLGGLIGAGPAIPSSLFALLATGFCGALSTYSTFSHETLRLVERRAYLRAAANVVLSVGAGLAALSAGYAALHALTA